MDDEQPTESTPLVLHRSTVRSRRSPHLLPPLTPIVDRIRLYGTRTLDEDPTSLLLLSPTHATSLAQQVSIKVIVLSRLYIRAQAPPGSIGTDVWEQWSKERAPSLDAEDLQRRVVQVWEEFLRVSRSTEEIEECLWSSFALEEGKSRTIRVVDILKDPDAPPALVSHRLISLSLSRTWTHGRTFIPAESFVRRILQRLSSAATPRVVHTVDIFLQLGYLALLSDYVFHPPEPAIINTSLNLIGTREVLLTVYATGSLLRAPTFLVAPFALVAGAFLFNLPSAPFPGEASYSVLLGVLLLHVLLLHLPRIPSPTFLPSPELALPLATLLWHEFTRMLCPSFLFFLPATILSSYFLSTALEDSILRFPPALTFMGPAPMEIRMAFVVLWVILILLMTFSAILLVLFGSRFHFTSPHRVSPWDRYSVTVGLQSRRTFATAVAAYSVPYFFPPPFNLLQILSVHIPRLLLRLFGWKEDPVTERVEAVLWYLTTCPLALAVARRRTGFPQIGAPSEADKAITPVNLPSSSAFSSRTVRSNHVLPLTVICARLFVASFPKFSRDTRQWEPRKGWKAIGTQLKSLPDSTIQTLFAMLSSSCPQLLSHDLVKEHFLRGHSVTLTSGMGGERSPISKYTVGAVASMGPGLVRLHLIGFDKMTDQSFAAVVSRHPSLEDLSVCGCTLVGPKTIQAVAKTCPSLKFINLNYTSVTPLALAPLLRSCKERLEMLKVAGISSWTDKTFAQLHTELLTERDFSLPALRTLKLRQTSLSDASINALIPLAPNVSRVDVSFTDIRRPLVESLHSMANLEKLSVTSTSVSPDDLLSILPAASQLRTLNIGALGGSHGKKFAYGTGISTMTFTDEYLRSLTAVLSQNSVIENISLVANTKLARDEEIIAEFVLMVGRRLKKLNLSGLSYLRSSDLQHLAPVDPTDAACSLRELSLNSTGIDDDASPYISCCPSLEILEVAGTKLSSEGLFTIIDACPKLANLNLTRCRGVSVADRRHFFETWEDSKHSTDY
ncbi:hypothetical protein F5148DRAFT_1324597 [Russula earlei]|uniref:Uncharacterized protein n=1 Tax=Russula earlei TaxID=71964 RepID=A0ACC0U0A7_9AGAM|nr:hypothetical protein F5148DRAFT_1324597 [Russula earlei]